MAQDDKSPVQLMQRIRVEPEAITEPYVPTLALRVVHGYSQSSDVQRALTEVGATELYVPGADCP